jgi:NADH-quinone oxidoreductase subunit C
MFGIVFEGHPHPVPLLLPDGFEGHPLRKDFVLASRVAKPWPGAKEPGESDAHEGVARSPGRRRILPPGVPDPNEWGPQAGTAQEQRQEESEAAAPAPGRAGRGPGDRPSRADRPRRARSASQGSASQRGQDDTPGAGADDTSERRQAPETSGTREPAPGEIAPDDPSAAGPEAEGPEPPPEPPTQEDA